MALAAFVGYFAYASLHERSILPPALRSFDAISSSVVTSRANGSLTLPPSPTPRSTTSSPVGDTNGQAGRVFLSVNAQRVSTGLPSLTELGLLTDLAQKHAADMAARAYFSHTSPDGIAFEQRVKSSGYGAASAAENIGITSGDVIDVVAGWMDSPSHRANIVDEAFLAAGAGVARGTWDGTPVFYVVVLFGSAI